MRNQVRRKYNTLLSVKGYMETHPLVPPLPDATAQMVVVTGSIATIESLGGTQAHGEGEALGATDSRELIAVELRAALREISGIAKQLDQTLYPGAKAAFRLTGIGTFTGVLNRARSFTESAGPIKAAFVGRGLPADFDEILAGLVADMAMATNRRVLGVQERKQGTVGMAVAADAGIKAVRVLDSIMTVKLKSDPVMLAVWKAAQRIERDPVRKKGDVPFSTAVVATSAGPIVAKAASDGEAVEIPETEPLPPRVNGTAPLLA
jgi:hypothetical protein